ncbi:hypothetical protein RhiirC2_776997 [Rhizophagus irregularis]|uniref:Crinkler family protein n=1 Tax=Rhizophagus irregularis TaxID=588596 RepID=A0A2N1NFF7_9GLOM|nr:hypothetical protein RhiirC2_776997 [Rhizophagus irregularis]
MVTLDVYDEVNRLFEILDDEKLTEKEVADLFTYFNDAEKLPSVEKALTKSKNDKVKLTYLRNLLASEYPNKRIKYDIDDQKLKKSWDALKHGKVEKHGRSKVLDLSEDVYYLLGKDEQGFNISTLFIRKCYKDLYKMISKNNHVRRWRITGNPGIGKTFFGFYLLYFLAKQRKTVVYHKLKKPPMLFSENGVFSYPEDNIHALKRYLANEEVWYIVDGREPMEYVAKTILICSPQKSHYSQFDKLGVTIRYMPVWSWAEIDLCRGILFRNLTQEHVRELYNKWGGIPRYTLFYALNDGQQAFLQMAINSVNDKILNFIGETTDDNNSSHKIVHIRTNVEENEEEEEGEEEEGEEVEEEEEVVGESSLSSAPKVTRPDKGKGVAGKGVEGIPSYSTFTLEFASDYVSEKVMDNLIKNYKESIAEFRGS